MNVRDNFGSLLTLVFFVLSVAAAHAASITGKVVGISDGDTLTVLTPAKEQVKVRLHGIDTPEAKQAFGSPMGDNISLSVSYF